MLSVESLVDRGFIKRYLNNCKQQRSEPNLTGLKILPMTPISLLLSHEGNPDALYKFIVTITTPMTARKTNFDPIIDKTPVPNSKTLIQQLERKFGKKKQGSRTKNALETKTAPILTTVHHKQEEAFNLLIQQPDFAALTTHQDSMASCRFSRNFQLENCKFDENPEVQDVIVIVPQQQQKNSTFKRISAKFSKDMEDFHQRNTMSREKALENRVDFLLDQWFTYPEHQNRITRGVPIQIVETVASLLNLQIPGEIKGVGRGSSIIINKSREEK